MHIDEIMHPYTYGRMKLSISIIAQKRFRIAIYYRSAGMSLLTQSGDRVGFREPRGASVLRIIANLRQNRWGIGLREILGALGPGFVVSVGYMDPGNWGTNLAAGAGFGYQLLWVILVSNIIAIFLQIASAKLGIATGKNLAQLIREQFSRPAVIFLGITTTDRKSTR